MVPYLSWTTLGDSGWPKNDVSSQLPDRTSLVEGGNLKVRTFQRTFFRMMYRWQILMLLLHLGVTSLEMELLAEL